MFNVNQERRKEKPDSEKEAEHIFVISGKVLPDPFFNRFHSCEIIVMGRDR